MGAIHFREEGNGRPIILIHGFCETLEIWNGFSSGLADSNKVYSIDLPGFGDSPLMVTPFTIDAVARSLMEWMSHRMAEKPVLVGHSLGGYVALAMCEQFPEKIGGLVLFHSTSYADSDERKANRNKVIDFVNNYGVDPFIDTFVPGLFKDRNHPAVPWVDKIARKTRLKTLVGYAEAMRDRPSRTDFLRSFKQPFLVIGGKWDQTIPPGVSEELGNLSEISSSFILFESAHIGMIEQPVEATVAIKKFTSEL